MVSKLKKLKTKEQKHEENLRSLRSFRLFDDTYMTRFFADNIPCTEFVLRILMDKPDLQVKKTQSQVTIKHLEGRSVRLDVYAMDSQGKRYDIEVQRSNAGAEPHRARYNASMIDADNLQAGEEFEELPDSYVIFITENDIWKMGEPVYPVERINLKTGKPFNDGSHILYVNGMYRDDSDIGKLMHDFSCSNPADMHFKILAERASFLKEKEEGVAQMCRVMDELRKETIQEKSYEVAANLLNMKKLTKEEIAQVANITVEEVEELEQELQAK